MHLTPCSNYEQLTNGNAEDSNSSPDCLTLEAGHAAYKKIMSSFDLKSASMGETKEPGFTTKDKNVIQNLSLKTAGKRRHNLDMIKVQVICSLLCNNLYQLKILQEAATASLMIGKLGNEKLIRCSVE